MNMRASVSSLSPRDRRALRMGAWIVLPLLAASVVLRPYLSALLVQRAALENQRGLLARELRAVRDAPSEVERLQEGNRVLVAEAARLFGGNDAVTATAELARYVTARAAASGLRVDQAESGGDREPDRGTPTGAPLGPSSAADSGALRVTLRAQGGSAGVYAFLRAMETGPKLVRIERIEIAQASTDDIAGGTLVLTTTVCGLARRSFVAANDVVEEEP